MPTDAEQILEVRRQRDAAHAAFLAASRDLRAADAQLRAAERAGDQRQRELLEERNAKAREKEALQGRVAGLRADARGLLDDWVRITPQEQIGQLSDANPFVLLPVRLETRFARTPAGAAELRVRIFPDDISIASPPGPLSEDEQRMGEAYWAARLAALAAPTDAQRDREYVGAWTTLATRSGAYRAGYVLKQTKPANWDAVAAAPGAVAPLPAAPEAETAPAVARAHGLPDRFVVMVISGTEVVDTVAGKAVPDDLVLSPHPEDSATWVSRDAATGRLKFPPELEWLLDFDTAESVGMGIRIPLAPPWDQKGFDRVIAFGMRAATPPTEAHNELGALLALHRYNNGCALVANGTPTNNTESARSGWKPPSAEAEQLFEIEELPPALTPTPGALGTSDGWRLAQLLGLKQEFVARLPNAQATDISESVAMNRALMPATLGDFLRIFMSPVMSAADARRLEKFFVDHVSGRGCFPALRAGRQPYGVVVMSSQAKWQQEAQRGDDAFRTKFLKLLGLHRERWDKFAGDAPHAAQATDAPFDRLMKIIGLLASSADYVSRKAVSFESMEKRLHLASPADKEAINDWWARLRQGITAIDKPGFPGILEPSQPLISWIAFLFQTDDWRAPIVDQDPKVPLSERAAVAPFDGTRNYLDWLATVNLPTLRNQNFLGPDGKAISAPTALLYVLLRHSLLTATENGTGDIAGIAGGKFFDVIAADPLIANIGDTQHVMRRDYLQVDAAALGLAAKPVALGEWVFAAARDPKNAIAASATDAALAVEMLALAKTAGDVSSAIGALTQVPTARLERLLAEHVDLISYRLDAWITGLFQERLELMRNRQQLPAYYLGAYGWVENLKPNWGARQALPADEIPPAFRSFGPITSDASNGGFIHAPSLAHGATAAVLRNGYLSHATAANPSPFAVNLSSARVRAAKAVMEGVRNGQPIAALLGYQLERGLHERHGNLELDEYIYVLRARFPFSSGKLTELAPGVSNEAVEARNVVNMLDLLAWYAGKPYPYDIAALPAPGSLEANAIVGEIELARDTLDAVSDLLLSESVHQAVQGNFERTKASLQALTEPEAPPESELIRTPRTGRELALRVALSFDPAAIAGWNGTLTPRAAANAALNHWLKTHLPASAKIQWRVRNAIAAPAFENIGTYGLEPIDLVLMSGDTIGDRSSELERYLIRTYRDKQLVPDEVVTYIAPLTDPVDAAKSLVIDFADADGNVSLVTLQPLLTRLRRIITKARPAHALDWLLSTEIDRADKIDPKGVASGDALLNDFKDLRARITAALAGLKAALAKLLADVAANQANIDLLTGGNDAVVADPAWPAALSTLRKDLFAVLRFGFAEALPADGLTVTRSLIMSLVSQAKAVAAALDKRVKLAETLTAPNADTPSKARTDRILLDLTEAARQIFGPSFTIIPLFKFFAGQGNEVQQASGTPVTTDQLLIEEWLQGVSRVRPPIADLAWTIAAAGWLGNPVADPTVIQLPHEAGATWIGDKIAGNVARKEWLSVLNFGVVPKPSGVNAALVLDSWSETVPTDKETTGVAFHCNRPSAAAPQALLVVVPPVMRGQWQWDDVVACLQEALDLAKVRAVEPDQLLKDNGYFQLLPGILNEFTQSRFASVHYAARSVEAISLAGKI